MSCMCVSLLPPPRILSCSRRLVNEIKNNNKSKIDKNQQKQISDLQRKVGQLKSLAAMPRKSRRAQKKRNILSSAANNSRHILHDQAVAMIQPFKAIGGVGQHLIDALPSQKYTLRSRASATVPASGAIAGLFSPYCWIDTEKPSGLLWMANSASAAEASTDPIFESTVAGSTTFPTGFNSNIYLAPNRPYAVGDGRTCRLVSYGVRVRYTGAALYASGTLKMLATPHGEFQLVSGTTFNRVVSQMNGSHATQLKSIYDRAVYDFNFIGNASWSPIGSGADQDMVGPMYRVGKASSPCMLSEPGAYMYYVNNSGNAVTFEVELIENWEVRGTNIAAFYTDSHTDPALHHEIVNIVNTAHQRAGLSTATKFTDVVSTVSKASKSPLGKAVLAAALA